MIIRPEMRHHVIFDLLLEFKYVPLSQPKTEDEKGSKKSKHTLSGTRVKQMSYNKLKALKAVQSKLDEARTQLLDYRQILQQKYGDVLKLRTYAVVAIGFERLVWEEVQD